MSERFDTPVKKKKKGRKSEEEEHHEKGEYYEDWKETSKWSQHQLDQLKIIIDDVATFDEFLKDYLKIDVSSIPPPINTQDFIANDLSRHLLINDTYEDKTDISRESKRFANFLLAVFKIDDQTKNPESIVDSFVDKILLYLGFADDGFCYRPKPKSHMDYGSVHIISESDFGCYFKKTPDVFVLLDESKKLYGVSLEKLSYQIAGEAFVHSFNRYLKSSLDIWQFLVSIRGYKAIFYHAYFSKSYMSQIDKGKIPDSHVTILRYPSEELNLLEPNDRKMFANILLHIRAILLTINK